MLSMHSASLSLLCASLVFGPAASAEAAPAASTPTPIVVSTASSPYSFLLPVSAVAADGSFVAAWSVADTLTDNDNVHLRRFEATGMPISAEQVGNTTRGNGSIPIRNDVTSIASDAAGNFVVAWYQITDRTSDLQLKARLFNAGGSPRSEEFCVDPACSSSFIGSSQIAMADDGRFVVTYSEVSDTATNVFSRRFGADGTALDAQPIAVLSSSHFMGYSTGMNRQTGDFTVGWMTTEALGQYRQHNLRKITKFNAQRYLASGAPLGDSLSVAMCVSHLSLTGMVSGCQLIADGQTMADDRGNLTFAWSQLAAQPAGASVTYVRHYDSTGAATGPEVRLADSMLSASAGDGAGNFVLKLDSGARAFSANNKPLDAPSQLSLASSLSGSSSGGFIGSWLASNQGGLSIYAQPYTLP